MFNLTISPLGDPDRTTRTAFPTQTDALAALISFAGSAYRINHNPASSPVPFRRIIGGTLSSPTGSGVHQASYAFTIR